MITANVSTNPLHQKILNQLKTHPVLLYMKGDRSFPQCGFSARVIEILNSLGVNFETFDILSDPEMRQGLKEFSNWPTFPQLYVQSQLIGGCDIVSAMAESGELAKLFRDKKILS